MITLGRTHLTKCFPSSSCKHSLQIQTSGVEMRALIVFLSVWLIFNDSVSGVRGKYTNADFFNMNITILKPRNARLKTAQFVAQYCCCSGFDSMFFVSYLI